MMIKTVNLNSNGVESFFHDGKGKDYIPNTSRYAWPTDSGRGSNAHNQTNRSSKSLTNSFFTRNSPHPSRVKHIKGLLDVPICTVLDAENGGDSRPGTRFSVATPGVGNDTKNNTMENILKLAGSSKLKEKAVPHIGLGKIETFQYPTLVL